MRLRFKFGRFAIVIAFLTFSLFGLNAATVIKLASYNIKGTSMVASRMTEVIKAVKSAGADCVALQEVNSYTKGDDESYYSSHDWLGQLMTGSNMNYSFFLKTDAAHKPYYGIGMLTKTKPINLTTKVIANPGGHTDRTSTNDYGEDRGLIIAEFDDYYFIGAHFSLVADYRKVMIDWIVDTIATLKKPVFIAGDFNMTWSTTPMPYLKAGGLNTNLSGNAYSYPSSLATKCIDYVIGQSVTTINGFGYDFVPYGGGLIPATGTNLTLASDHLPIFAQFQLGRQETGMAQSRVKDSKYHILSRNQGIQITGINKEVTIQIYDSIGHSVYSHKATEDVIVPLTKTSQVHLVCISDKSMQYSSKIVH